MPEIKEELMKILKEKLRPQPVKIRSIFKLTCYTFDGIDAIKASLLNGEKKGTENIPIKFRIIGSPLYECNITTINIKEGFEVMKSALTEVQKSIEERGGNFLLEVNPEALGENEKNIGEQMREDKNKQEEEEIKHVNFEENEFSIIK